MEDSVKAGNAICFNSFWERSQNENMQAMEQGNIG
ncbi:hypothetical protein PALU110988_14445 [Paenibacillus lupini]|nr:hypothetical protein [Paenibacillus lupini]